MDLSACIFLDNTQLTLHIVAHGEIIVYDKTSLTVKQVADLLGHTTTEITELYYVKKDNTKLEGLTDAFNL